MEKLLLKVTHSLFRSYTIAQLERTPETTLKANDPTQNPSPNGSNNKQ